MARKIIKCKLNEKSIQSAIDELNKYKENLIRKNKIFVDKLAEIGLNVVQITMESIPNEEKGSYYTETILGLQGKMFFLSSFRQVLLTERTLIHCPLVSRMELEHIPVKHMHMTRTDGGILIKVDRSIIPMVTGLTCQCIMQKKLLSWLFIQLQRKYFLIFKDGTR